MEILILIILIILVPVLFIGGGVLGHIIDGFSWVISFLIDGCMRTTGCLIAVIFLLLLLCALAI
jgi:hypothetical protein